MTPLKSSYARGKRLNQKLLDAGIVPLSYPIERKIQLFPSKKGGLTSALYNEVSESLFDLWRYLQSQKER